MNNNVYRFISLALAVILLPSAAQSQAVAEAELVHPVLLDSGTVKAILKSDMIELSDSRRYRLDNVLVPPLEDSPAVDELDKEILGKQVMIYSYHDEKDKQGIPLVQVIADKDLWVQEDLVAKGLAWAYSTESSEQMAHTLKIVEDDARLQHLGFWRKPSYAIKTPQNVRQYMGSYQVVEGKVLSVNQESYSNATFLNFGNHWKTDFEVRITGDNRFMSLVKDPRESKRFKGDADMGAKENVRAGVKNDDDDLSKEDKARPELTIDDVTFDPHQWEGRIVRVRGWVHGNAAPVIDVTHKEQIDFVDDDR